MSTVDESYLLTTPQALQGVGVPRDVALCELKSFKEGIVVWQWLKDEGYVSLARGGNWFFETTTTESIKTLPLLVKTLIVRHPLGVYFVRLGQIVKLLTERNYKEFDRIASKRFLVIGDFYEPSRSRRDSGISASQRSLIETMLLDRKDRIDATVFQIHNPHHLLVNNLDPWRSFVFDQLKPKRLKVAVPPTSVSSGAEPTGTKVRATDDNSS